MPIIIAFLDSSLLSILITPILFVLAYQPMQYRIRELHDSHIALMNAQEQQEVYHSVVQETSEAVMITNTKNEIVYINASFTKLTGYTAQEVLGNTPKMLSSGNHSQQFYASMWSTILKDGHWRGELQNRKKSGAFYVQHASISKIDNENGITTHFVAVFHDITDQKEEEDQLRYRAQHDFLTGLPNRTLFIDRLEQVFSDTRRNKRRAAVLFLDLDRFKPINDTYGHAVGDQLLMAVASSIRRQLREEDTVSRIGGDEFTIILRNISQHDDAGLLASKILDQLSKPFHIEDKALSIGVSIGIAICPDQANTMESLLKKADAAMYKVKQSGRNHFQYFTD
jgi:diguanylate cyclase (GGDEF)-like protein/PAS domain S-box-containing protein